jgi:hypothetical protein
LAELKTAAAAVCGTMLLSAILLFLLPQNGQRMMRFAVRIFFLLSLLIPFTGWTQEDFTLPEETEQSFSEDLGALVQRQLEQAVVGTLQAQAEEILARCGAAETAVEITIHNRGDAGISITSLKVYPPEEELDAVLEAVPELTETFGITVTLERAEGQNDGKAEETDGE